MPRISVIMPVYNCENYIREAVESILTQTFTDFELLIIDDASTDQTVSIIKTYADQRIRLIEKSANSGYPDSLNMGLKIASGEFIARMDGDDISSPERFALQLAAFENNQKLVLCGSFMEIIGTGEMIQFPQSHDEIKVSFLRICCIAHPSVMFKRSFVQDNNLFYDRSQEPAEDFHLWVRMIKMGMFVNLSQPLLKYRVHANQVSTKKQQDLVRSGVETKILHLSSVITREAAAKFYNIGSIIEAKNVAGEIEYLNWLDKEIENIKVRNESIHFFAGDQLNVFLKAHKKTNARTIFLHSKIYNFSKLRYFIKYIFKNPGYFSFFDVFKNSMKCLLFYNIK